MNNENLRTPSANESLFGGKTIQEIASMSEAESDAFLKKFFQESTIKLSDYAALRVNVAGARIQNQGSGKEGAETVMGGVPPP